MKKQLLCCSRKGVKGLELEILPRPFIALEDRETASKGAWSSSPMSNNLIMFEHSAGSTCFQDAAPSCSVFVLCCFLMCFFILGQHQTYIYIYKTLWLLTSQYSLSYNSHWDLSLSPKGPHPPSTLYTLFAWLHDLEVLFWWPTEFNWAFLLKHGWKAICWSWGTCQCPYPRRWVWTTPIPNITTR